MTIEEVNPRLLKSIIIWLNDFGISEENFESMKEDEQLLIITRIMLRFGYSEEDLGEAFLTTKTLRLGLLDFNDVNIPKQLKEKLLKKPRKKKILNFINKNELDNWDARTSTKMLQRSRTEFGLSFDKLSQRKKLVIQSKNIKNIDAVEKIIKNPLCDRKIINIFISRLTGSIGEDWSKQLVELLIHHPTITKKDLEKIKNMKSWRNGSKLFDSKSVNVRLLDFDQTPQTIEKAIKKNVYEMKLKISKMDLAHSQQELLVSYTLLHNIRTPEKVKEIFSNTTISLEGYNKAISDILDSIDDPIKILNLSIQYECLKEPLWDKLVTRFKRLTMRNNFKDSSYKKALIRIIEENKDKEQLLSFLVCMLKETGDSVYMNPHCKELFLV